ncbi:plasmid protein [Acetobacter sacchari]|uniref:Plasmid protein n=2 Tax=Acetobacter sacchari TaxID=2661687 RepID=A0ABS3LWL5_9PROT|nr:plasmid protein [Acetobacter sacchari]
MQTLFNTLLEEARSAASQGNGCSYELYVQKFTSEIDRRAAKLAPEEAAQLVAMATSQGDYVAPCDQVRFPGCCSHGIEWGCCPAGCDDDDGSWCDDARHDDIIALEAQFQKELAAEEERERLELIAARDARVLDRIHSFRQRTA